MIEGLGGLHYKKGGEKETSRVRERYEDNQTLQIRSV